MAGRNWRRELERTLEGIKKSGDAPKLLLHSCCGPCSSYVLELLSAHFDVSVLYYNPNIYPEEEFSRRLEAQEKLIGCLETARDVRLIVEDYLPSEFEEAVEGVQAGPEGGERCLRCYALRLDRAARRAREMGFDYFATTLSVSPHKNADAINAAGEAAAERRGVRFLPADFKKNNGYGRSVELSRRFGLYRQDYCGCRYSYEARREKK